MLKDVLWNTSMISACDNGTIEIASAPPATGQGSTWTCHIAPRLRTLKETSPRLRYPTYPYISQHHPIIQHKKNVLSLMQNMQNAEKYCDFFLLFSESDAIFGCGTSKKLTTAGRLLAQVATIPWSTPVWKSLETVTPAEYFTAKVLEILLHRFNCDPVFKRNLLDIDFAGLLCAMRGALGRCEMKSRVPFFGKYQVRA